MAKNDNITLSNNNSPDFKNLPIIEDVFKFYKNKNKKPVTFYPIQHYKYLIPALENLETNKNKNKIKINPETKILK